MTLEQMDAWLASALAKAFAQIERECMGKPQEPPE